MKITINKNQQRINFKKHIWTIIEIAKQTANKGMDGFNYTIPRNEGISAYTLIDAVEKETEHSVYGGYKCISNGIIKFSIRD
tara:strand:- start:680 stop:925 length:246 start_codon:yes stop_codon:yes gene_type:complete